MFKDTLVEALYGVWPMIVIFTVILSSIRIAFLLKRKNKFVFYREICSLFFIIYILILFYVVTFQDVNYGESNFMPFREMFRYDIGSKLFMHNIVGNLLLFVPFGLFVSYYLRSKGPFIIIILSFISSLAIEITQYKIGRVFDVDDVILNIIGGFLGYLLYVIIDSVTKQFPKFLRQAWFLNLICLILLISVIIYLFGLEQFWVGL
jgi:glycopeptide antibiotics resistance protein